VVTFQPPDNTTTTPVWDQVSSDVSLAGSARSLLLTVLGELVGRHGPPVWTAALLHVLTGLGLEEQTARQAIARGASAGWIAGEKRGREVRWQLTNAGAELIEDVRSRAESLHILADTWDGNCLILMISIPQQQKTVRKRLYNALKWAGFGNPMPGCWASPHVDRAEEVMRVIHDLGLQDSAIGFLGRTWTVGLTDQEIVHRAWDLNDVATRYSQLISTFTDLEPEPGDDLLLTYLTLVHEWQEFPFMDPQLPRDLLPNWIGWKATELFGHLRESWAPLAHSRWQEIIELTAPVPRPTET
jgi:phenylacetic acid degradation operon negative regulatory protein